MRIQKDNKAVSPVIGIMLMLVVTVILAAAVSSSSTGLMKSTEKAPFAVFDVKIYKDAPETMAPAGSGQTRSDFRIRHINGDAINTRDLKIVTETATNITEIVPGKTMVYLYNNASTTGLGPYLNDMSYGYWPNINTDFGNFTLKPGRVMVSQQFSHAGASPVTYPTYDVNTSTYSGDPGMMQAAFANWDAVKRGDFVNVKIIHMPSDKVIFASDVEVI